MAAVAKVGERSAPKETSQLAATWKRFRKHSLGLIGLITLTTVVISCIVVPMVSPFTYDQIDTMALVPDARYEATAANFQYKPALWDSPAIAGNPLAGDVHILGTDAVGRDNLTRVFQGGRISLAVGLITTMIVVIFGSIVGSIAGFYGSWADTLLMRFVDLLLSLPILPVLLVISKMLDQSGIMTNLFGKSLGTVATIILVLSLFGWLGISRLVRGS